MAVSCWISCSSLYKGTNIYYLRDNLFTWYSSFLNLSSTVEFTVAAHDTTGGMVTKITEAAMIAKLGIDVYITKVICFPGNSSSFIYFPGS